MSVTLSHPQDRKLVEVISALAAAGRALRGADEAMLRNAYPSRTVQQRVLTAEAFMAYAENR